MGRGQGNASKTRGGGSRPAPAEHVTGPVQRGGTAFNHSTGNEGHGFRPSVSRSSSPNTNQLPGKGSCLKATWI